MNCVFENVKSLALTVFAKSGNLVSYVPSIHASNYKKKGAVYKILSKHITSVQGLKSTK